MVKPVALVVAMQSELVHLVPHTVESHPSTSGVWSTLHTQIGETPVVAVRCGIGMVNAAAATEHVISTFDPQAVMNFGCTGSHVRDQYPGDVVIGTGSVAHVPVRVDSEGLEIFRFGGFGVGEDAESENYFPSDPGLVDLAVAAAERWQPDSWPVGHSPRSPRVERGNVGSGDVWNQHVARLERLHALHGTLCEDMEAAAIAQVAKLHGVPFLTIKDISNNEYLEVTDFDDHGAGILEAELGRRAGQLTWKVIEALAVR